MFLSIIALQYGLSFLYVKFLMFYGVLDLGEESIFSFHFLGIFLFIILSFPVFWALFLWGRSRFASGGRLELRAFLSIKRLASALLVSGFLYVALIPFAHLKSLIRHALPYPWDDFFRQADLLVHFNHYPHELLYAVLPRDMFLPFIDFVYSLWFFVLYIVLAFALYKPPLSFARQHFLVAFALIWFLVGNVLATLFASAGPIFYDVFHDHVVSYSAAFAYLKANGAAVLTFYDTLIGLLHDDFIVDINGPSAVPSVHVAIAGIIFFYFRQYGTPRQKLVSFLFLLVIMVGSVYLLWHYAVDAYFALIGAYLIWKGSEYLLHKFQPELT